MIQTLKSENKLLERKVRSMENARSEVEAQCD